MKRKSELYLKDILDSIKKIEGYIQSFDFEDFKNSSIVIDASVRNLEIIGEAVSQMSQEVKDKYLDVPWQEIKNFRNLIIHKYHRVDIEILWDIIKNKLDILRQQIKDVIKKEINKK